MKKEAKEVLIESFWESLMEHFGKALDRMDPVDTMLYSIAAYSGYNWNEFPGAILGLLSLKLATVPMSRDP